MKAIGQAKIGVILLWLMVIMVGIFLFIQFHSGLSRLRQDQTYNLPTGD